MRSSRGPEILLLSLDVDEVVLGMRELAEYLFEVDRLRVHVDLPEKESNRLGQATDRIDVQALDDSGFLRIGRGYQEPGALIAQLGAVNLPTELDEESRCKLSIFIN